MCGVCVYWWDLSVQTHMHTKKSLHETLHTQQGFNSFFIVSVHRTSSTVDDKKKIGEKHKPSREEHVPFEVAFLLGTSFGVT